MKRSVYFILPVFFVLAFDCWGVDESATTGVRFMWAFGARVTQNGAEKLIRIEKDTTLHTGDQIKMFIKPQSDCYIYLVYLSSAGELLLLYPSNLSEPGSEPGSAHFIPSDSGWFLLDEVTGKEKFYLIASNKRLSDLEALLLKHLDRDTGTIRKHEAVKAVLAEIKETRRQNRSLNTTAEKPIRIGGNFRGADISQDTAGVRDVAQLAVQITAPEFFARTFTIDHR